MFFFWYRLRSRNILGGYVSINKTRSQAISLSVKCILRPARWQIITTNPWGEYQVPAVGITSVRRVPLVPWGIARRLDHGLFKIASSTYILDARSISFPFIYNAQ